MVVDNLTNFRKVISYFLTNEDITLKLCEMSENILVHVASVGSIEVCIFTQKVGFIHFSSNFN